MRLGGGASTADRNAARPPARPEQPTPAGSTDPPASPAPASSPVPSPPAQPAAAVQQTAPPAGARPPGPPSPDHGQAARSNGCTAPQLRRFIKSRPYVPMHELRRRFAIDGGDDDVTRVRLDDGSIYVGLPPREGSLLGELLRGGEIGYELSLDPRSPVVVGVYPMRPVPRP